MSIKIAILEIDGVELDIPTEMDLIDALSHVGYTSGSSNIQELSSDPTSPSAGESWVITSKISASPFGLLLALTREVIEPYKLSYKTLSGLIVRTNME